MNTGDIEIGILDCTGCKNYGVVVLLQIFEGQVFAILNVSEESNVTTIEHFEKCIHDSFYSWMIRRNAVTHQTVGCRQQIKKID